ncbi:hypothetical protein CKAN_00407200 [Cinnamomum micranthum f. kanehirae]|uniref:Uncharacterized protein n=1 Tax=Cinnamomum micranthum f. kanehirae TaxID=337451 RepID=A0A3S3PY39_9MAGN|nr:hypothetical protein CKAN_00407200 [Cinnamomum micranthum f. kanehirae]
MAVPNYRRRGKSNRNQIHFYQKYTVPESQTEIFLQAQTTYIYPLCLLPHNHPARAQLLFFSKNIKPSKRKNPKQPHEVQPSEKPRKEKSVGDAFDSLPAEIFIDRLHHNNNGSNINLLTTVLTPSLPLISSSPNTRDESGLGYVAKEEVKIEGEIIRIILSSDTDSLRPNSGQPIPIYRLHQIPQRKGIEHWVWECHGHVMTYDESNSLSLECIFGIYFEGRRGNQGI